MLRDWDSLPEFIKVPEVKPYYNILNKHRISLILKRIFDILFSCILIILLAVPMLFLAIIIKIESPGPIFYMQERVTTYGKKFKIHKFRTMVKNADKIGSTITVWNDSRVTKVGRIIRRFRIDELPQVLDVLSGNMSFVGTRPEVPKYVEQYTPEMRATLLMPAGITSEASIRYKDENKLLNDVDDIDMVYLTKVLPEKMKWNLKSIRNFTLLHEISTLIRTIVVVLGKDYK